MNEKISEIIEKLLIDMKYGNIPLIVQDGKIIQIDKTEKSYFRIACHNLHMRYTWKLSRKRT
ncbi:MAG: YezD family protein [Ruminococcus sp.]|nr:YezD family protein [Ruminococcus sp.]